MQSLNTVSKQLNHDLVRVRERRLSEAEFLDKYGHLRPGTYDIESLRYDENFENWKQMPPRQECDTYPLPQRLRYSNCRRVMFDHLERDWKKKTFPTLADRLEFF